MAKWQRIKIAGHSRYVVRDKYGRFKDNQSIGKSIRIDRRKRAKRKVKRGYGHLGDYRKKRKSARRRR